MLNVTRFEASLLRLLYYFLRREPGERALPLVEARVKDPPTCLSRPVVKLVQDALAKGSTQLLAQRGGWRVEPHLRATGILDGDLALTGRQFAGVVIQVDRAICVGGNFGERLYDRIHCDVVTLRHLMGTD